jgi:hypothetical protein
MAVRGQILDACAPIHPHSQVMLQDLIDRGLSPSATYRAVAVSGGVDDWAAYVGPASDSNDEIGASGMKLTGDDACMLFPVLNPTRYRR